MKLPAAFSLCAALLFASGTRAHALPPAIGWFPPPSSPVRVDGPYHLRITAEWRAENRLVQGYYAMPVAENGKWWVAYYPFLREPSSHFDWLHRRQAGPDCPAMSDAVVPTEP